MWLARCREKLGALRERICGTTVLTGEKEQGSSVFALHFCRWGLRSAGQDSERLKRYEVLDVEFTKHSAFFATVRPGSWQDFLFNHVSDMSMDEADNNINVVTVA